MVLSCLNIHFTMVKYVYNLWNSELGSSQRKFTYFLHNSPQSGIVTLTRRIRTQEFIVPFYLELFNFQLSMDEGDNNIVAA